MFAVTVLNNKKAVPREVHFFTGQRLRRRWCPDRQLVRRLQWWSVSHQMERQCRDPEPILHHRKTGHVWPMLGVLRPSYYHTEIPW